MVSTSLTVSPSGYKDEVGIELPFMGFYESIHDENIDRAIESGFNYDYEKDEDKEISQEVYDAIGDADINWDAIRREYAKNYVEEFGNEFDLNLRFDDMTSPREYNFGTDRVFAWIPLWQINKIRKEVEEHEEYPEYIKERFTDRSGFWSNYSSNYKDEDWTREKLDECQYRTIVEFWLEHCEVVDVHETELYLMDSSGIEIWDSVTDAHEVIDKYLKEHKDV